MRRFMNVGVLLTALLLLLPVVAVAQETTGSLSGTVVNAGGETVSGAKVSLASERGTREATTDAQGRFLLAFLSPGTYSVTVSAEGLQSIKDDGVVVGLGQRLTRKYVLTAMMEESMTVEAPAEMPEPVISDLTTTTTGRNISQELAESIPLARNISSVVFLTPNVKSGGGTGAANPSIGGSSGFENQYVFDGVNVTNAGYGALGAFSNVYGSQGSGINFNFVKETQVITSGFAAEYGQATGGIVNLVTKSGTNEWDGTVYSYYTPTGLQSSFKTPDLSFEQAEIQGIEKFDYGFDVGGPLMKDHVFFWLGANPGTVTETRRAPDGYGLATRGDIDLTRDSLNWSGKLTIMPNPDHRIDLSAFGDPQETNYSFNRGSSALRADDETRFTKLETGYENYALKYAGTITPTFLAEGTIASSQNTFEELLTPLGDQLAGTDLTPLQGGFGNGITLGGIGYTEPASESKNNQYNFKFTNIIGDHELRYGIGMEDISYDFATAYTGPGIATRGEDGIPGTADDGVTTTGVTYQRRLDCSLIGSPKVTETEVVWDAAAIAALCSAVGVDPATVPPGTAIPVVYRVTRGQLSDPTRETNSKYTYAFVQDTWSTTPNVHINFGLRWERQSIDGQDVQYTFPSTLSPRIGVSWDHTRVGKSKLFGYWGRFYEKVPLDIAVRALSQEVSVLRDVYYDAGLSSEVLQGEGVGTRYLSTGLGFTEIVEDTENSYTDSVAAGYERDLGKGWSLKAEWQWRKIGDILEDFAAVPGGDIALGNADFGHYIIGNIPPDYPIEFAPGSVTNAYYPKAERDYQSLTVEGTHRSERWYFTAQYVLSHLHGNYEGLYRNDNGQSDPNLTSLFDFPNEDLFYYSFENGSLNTNRAHRVQLFGYYNWSNGWSLGSRFVGQSGTPKGQLASHPVYENGGEIALARRGSIGESGFEYGMDMNFGKKWTLPTKFESSVEINVDLFNLLNRRYENNWDYDVDNGVNLDVCTIDPLDPSCSDAQMQYDRLVESVANGVPNPDYNKATAYAAPREVRFGVKWTF